MYVGEPLPVVVLHDEIRFAFFNGPGRREVTGTHAFDADDCVSLFRPIGSTAVTRPRLNRHEETAPKNAYERSGVSFSSYGRAI